MTIHHKDVIGQPIKLRDVVISMTGSPSAPAVVTKINPKLVRLNAYNQVDPRSIMVVNEQMKSFDMARYTKLLDDHESEVDETPPEVKTSVRFIVKHIFDTTKARADNFSGSQVAIVRIEFTDAADRDLKMHNTIGPTAHQGEGFLVGVSQKTNGYFTSGWMSGADKLLTERNLCKVTALGPGVYTFEEWQLSLTNPLKMVYR